MAEPVPGKPVVAVIDIGSSAIRMIIAEVGPKSEIRYLENLQKPIPFGKEVFTNGKISAPVIREGIALLKNFKSVIDGYGIKNLHAIATSAVREAENRDNFIDQIFVRTGIDVEVIEGAEENRLELIAVEYALLNKVSFDDRNCLIIEVGSGSTEMIILNHGEVELTRTLSMGSIRLPEQALAGKGDKNVMHRAMKRSIHEIAQYAAREFSLGEIDTFIALGSDMRFVSRQIAERTDENYVIIEKDAYLNFVESLKKLSTEEVVEKYGISYTESETLYPALLFYSNFLIETKADRIIIPMMSIRDGLLLEMSQMLSGYKRTDVSRQVISSARKLGKKYKYDEAHALCVASLAVKFFDLLKEDHGLGSRERLLLEVSAILHDIGMYVSATSHHKHSSYLVDAADIFGIRKTDKNIVSNVVRYHRRSSPQTTHEPYMSLPKSDRAVVAKLAAILRVADALDRSHQQKIRSFSLRVDKDHYNLWVTDEVGDISIEREALSKKADMFTEVFGGVVVLKQGNLPK